MRNFHILAATSLLFAGAAAQAQETSQAPTPQTATQTVPDGATDLVAAATARAGEVSAQFRDRAQALKVETKGATPDQLLKRFPVPKGPAGKAPPCEEMQKATHATDGLCDPSSHEG